MAARKTPQTPPTPPGNGRPSGAVNRTTQLKRKRAIRGLKIAIDTGVMPLEVILKRMREPKSVPKASYEAAVAAAPYIHPKLTAVAYRDITPKKDTLDLSGLSDHELAVLRKALRREPEAAPPSQADAMLAIVEASEEGKKR